jgi:hypothetical protein
MEDDPAPGRVEHAIDDDTTKVQVGIEAGAETVNEGHRTETRAAPEPGLCARRQDATARRNSRKAAPWRSASRSRQRRSRFGTASTHCRSGRSGKT